VINWPSTVANIVNLVECDKPDSRRKNYVDNTSDDRQPVHHTERLSLMCRTKLTTRYDERRAVAKVSKSKVWDEVPEGSALIFGGARFSL